ncbi:hypothetical protein H3T50_01390 [Commensalibacter sp. M0134]|uniref:hypothetical protein n=1 Tax=Commensalibacter TaxID=1079922 RepID=UPI0018DC6D4B|nr:MULTISPECIES: hypothetical protein [Commensalibacter]MBI0065324.1 hypothetical protein [Commensalibacter sp. M0134]MBI0069207.1 hypothetical protein [Commensalibacter sp. M0133]MBI0081191.1 hypothetical protein [Commensalibacter melissae]
MANIILIIKSVCSFLWKGKGWIMTGLIYLTRRRAANRNNLIRTQDEVIKNDRQTIQTVQAMRQASNHSPGNMEELEDVLEKGKF